MPELPQVQALVEFLAERLDGAVLTAGRVTNVAVLKTVNPTVDELVGGQVVGVRRRGKWPIISIDAGDGKVGHVAIHLSRAGWIAWRDRIPDRPPRPGRGPLLARLEFATADGEVVGAMDLTEAGTRRSTSMWIVPDPTDVAALSQLGPEALDPLRLRPAMDAEALVSQLRSSDRAQIKGALRDQRALAGIGNAYSDEILHRAGLSPFQRVDALDDEQRDRLWQALTDVLAEALTSCRGLDPGQLKDAKRSGFAVHGRAGQPCPVCGDVVCQVSLADSSLEYCPTCQTGGKRLRDRRLSRLLR